MGTERIEEFGDLGVNFLYLISYKKLAEGRVRVTMLPGRDEFLDGDDARRFLDRAQTPRPPSEPRRVTYGRPAPIPGDLSGVDAPGADAVGGA